MKLAKAFKALDPGGLLIVNDFLLNKDKTGPLQAALFNLMVATYSEKEMLTMIQEAGFREVAIVANDPGVGNSVITAKRP